MTVQTNTSSTAASRHDALAVHSVDCVVFTVPDIEEAVKFYTAFGMDVRREGPVVELFTFGHPHCWMRVVENKQPKALQYLTFGIRAEDEAAFRAKIDQLGIGCPPHPLATRPGIWLHGPDGHPFQLVVSNKVSPNQKTPAAPARAAARGTASAPARTQVDRVFPRWLSHVLLFTPDVSGLVNFSESVLGLRLSDRSGDLVAFMHTPHGSDHHLLACVKSEGPGLHHTSWDLGSVDEVGEASEQMRNAGYADGWGVGRHVLGSNYFYYVRDPWGSFAEYSADIDFIAEGQPWQAGDYAPEDSFYLWGPAVPDWFVANTELIHRT
jgi:catechol 2,3-dioxygenase-like lactoylglutathione lyase family enzyme